AGLARPAGEKRYPSFYDQKKEATLLRAEVDWLADVPANVCQDLLQRLDRAWQRCFDQGARQPHFKAKGHDPVSLCEPGKKVWRLEQKHGRHVLIFPKLGYVPIVLHRPLEGERATATITHEGDQWFVSIVCHVEVADPKPPLGPPVGLDRGVANLVADSTDHLEPRPAFLTRAEAKIARASQKLSRTKKGSKNRAKARAKLGVVHRKVRRQRENLLHTLALRYAKNHRVVIVEDLKIANMVRSAAGTLEEPGVNVAQKRGLNRRILQMGWGQFVTLLEQKATRYGSTVVKVPGAFSSQECAACGHVDAASRPTQDRFECTGCGHQDHADLNAPKVLVKRYEESTRRTGGGEVCGGDSVGRPVKQKRRSVRTTTPSRNARGQRPVVHGGDGLPRLPVVAREAAEPGRVEVGEVRPRAAPGEQAHRARLGARVHHQAT
ncbi:MAG: transposase, partial [Myxococcaceae bacterium]